MTSILLYNLYPKNNWKEITKLVLENVPYHDSILVNVSLDRWDQILMKQKYITYFLKKNFPKISKITYTSNNPKLGEVIGFDRMRKEIDYDYYDSLTYTHSKGVTKPKDDNIKDWVKMMTYFLVERHDLCIKAFEEGYSLYGTRLSKYDPSNARQYTYKYCDFWYAGTFVSVNLKKIKKEFINTSCVDDYFGVEAFFGNLCKYKEAYSVHNTPFSLYTNPYPEELYKK